MAPLLLSQTHISPSSIPRRWPQPLDKRRRPVVSGRAKSSDDSPSSTTPIQFSPAFAQLLQQSLARQSRSTAERIGIPGLVLDETVSSDGGGAGGDKDDDGTGAFVWGAGAALASLVYSSSDQVRGTNVLELGCGTGVVSIAAAAAGAKTVVATDLPSRLAAAERNVAANERGVIGDGTVVRVVALDWAEGEDGVNRVMDDDDGFDWVLGADLTYQQEALAPLARTVAAALRVGGRRRGGNDGAPAPPKVLLAHRPRSREVDALMVRAFEAEGLALVVEEEEEGEGALLTGLAAFGGDGGDGEGDDEPLILYRVVVASTS